MHQPNGKAEPIYQKLAGLLERMILDRALRGGERLPSIRNFSVQQNVSVPTALQAYAILETRGLIEARPKSGYYVRHRLDDLPGMKFPGHPPRITDFSNTDPYESMLGDLMPGKFVPLGAALPSVALLPGMKLTRIMAAIGRRMGAASVGYDMVPGNETLRLELARRSMGWGCSLRPEDFTITLGASEAVSLALRATCQPGDTVVVEAPTYFGFARMLRELRLNALPIAVDSAEGLDLEALRAALASTPVSACLLIPSFHNPVGFAMPDVRKREVVELLAAHGIPLIEDDIYGDMQHEGARPRCLKAYDHEGGVILCSSFSKTLAPGYRVGYLSGGRWHSQITALKRATTLSNAALPALAVAEFLRNGGYDRYLRTLRQCFRRQVDGMREAVIEEFPEGTRVSRPAGGFLLWCELPEAVDSLELFRQARASGISIAPGPLFSPDGSFRNFIRLNCGDPWSKTLHQSVKTIGRLSRRMLCRR